ncbi:MAG: triose-phosphate isomerase [Acidimicrobiaceae bacterium]|nr:triose-phosphate isomerase [Acidimicrobiaceae bacterium]
MATTRRPLISGNWKMHHNHFEAIQTVQKLAFVLNPADHDAVDVSVHPPFTDIRSVQTVIESDEMRLLLGAQHCHFEEKGAYTGEVAPGMLAKLNVALVIVGHSERRQVFGETDDDVCRKVGAVLANGMTPIMCCGETQEEREADATEERVTSQVQAGLAGLSADQVGGLVVAYEPIWAIGTGLTATPEDAQAVCRVVRQVVADGWGQAAADAVRIQYGGSVKPVNAPDLMVQPDVDGLLVGGASLDADEFARIVAYHRLVG